MGVSTTPVVNPQGPAMDQRPQGSAWGHGCPLDSYSLLKGQSTVAEDSPQQRDLPPCSPATGQTGPVPLLPEGLLQWAWAAAGAPDPAWPGCSLVSQPR